MTDTGLEFRLLGPLEVLRNGRPIALGGSRQRGLLAMLLIRAGAVVRADQLLDAIWDRPPVSASSNLRTHVAALRRVLGDRIVTDTAGYRIVLRPGETDLAVFEELAGHAEQSLREGDPAAAADLFGRAAAIWRGPALAGTDVGPGLRGLLTALEERRLEVAEQWVEARIRSDDRRGLAAELRELLDEHPLREGLWGQLIRTLHHGGRQAAALAAYQRARALLADQLGVEPGPELQAVRQQIVSRRPAPGPSRPAELPHAVGAFTGRAPELDRLDRFLAETDTGVPVIVVTGTAGVGKSALAVHWAHRIAAAYPDGQLFLPLHGYSAGRPARPADALRRVLLSLGVPAASLPTGTDDLAARYRTALSGRRLLVVLDDAFDSEHVRPLLPGHPGCLILATSRDSLAGLVALDGARAIRLDQLRPAESRQLLEQLLDAGRLRAEPGAADQLAECCGHLPLALRLAAAQLGARPDDPVGTLVDRMRIGNRLAVLELPGDPRGPVRRALDQSLDALDPAAHQALVRLGTSPGADVGADLAEFLAGRHALDQLTAAHLVDRQPSGRYRMHDLVREYVVESAGPAGAAVGRVAGWYLHSVDAASRVLDPHRRRTLRLDPAPPDLPIPVFGGEPDALAWCEAERTNLVAAVEYAAGLGLDRLAWQLPVAMFGFLELRRYWSDWISTHEIGLAAARRDGSEQAEAWMHNSLGIVHKQRGDYHAALAHYHQALALRSRLGDRHGEAMVLNNLGTALTRSGDPRAALARLSSALRAFRDAGDRWGEGIALTNLGEALRHLDRHAAAARLFEQALAIRSALADRRGEGLVLHNLAGTEHALGQLDPAISHYREAHRIRAQAQDTWGAASSLTELGRVLTDTGHRSEARDCLGRALKTYEQLGDPRAGDVRALLAAGADQLR